MKYLKVFENFDGDDNDVTNPKFTDESCYDYLTRLGISVTKSHGTYKSQNGEVPEEDNCHIRPMGKKILYGFKVQKDSENFESYLNDKQIKYERHESKGARYPYQIIIEKGNKELTNEEIVMDENYDGAVNEITIGELIEKLQQYDPNDKLGFAYNGDSGSLFLGKNGELLEKWGTSTDSLWMMNIVYY